ncbi:protein of unknown function [Paraburkholderia dioscoreae]|uniref:Uncharacterized protein n=1 Tax=Paraburkholderia dioscoreae TaxID=2604047 RepID=A0A5Q4ZRY9_9BURK|nr:protein of unknown function [Paraburkholderia dioscoreae]
MRGPDAMTNVPELWASTGWTRVSRQFLTSSPLAYVRQRTMLRQVTVRADVRPAHRLTRR